MSRKNDCGLSDYTPAKQITFKHFVALYLKRIETKKLVFFDLTAGPGLPKTEFHSTELDTVVELKIKSSPIIFMEELGNIDRSLQVELVIFEKNAHSFSTLIQSIQPHLQNKHLTASNFHNRDFNDFLEFYSDIRYTPNCRGLIYFDPSGVIMPSGSFTDFCGNSGNVDILIHLSASGFKRVFSSKHEYHKQYNKPLKEHLDELQREFWYVTPPLTPQNWVFLYGSNERFPFKDDPTLKFKDILTDAEGIGIFDRLHTNNGNATAQSLPRILPRKGDVENYLKVIT